MINRKIGIIGCGNMGEALLSRLADVMVKSTSIMVSELDAKRRDYIQTKYKIIVEIDNNEVVKFADVIIVAVKPAELDALLKGEICCGISNKKLIISIAAGVTTRHIEKVVGSDIPVIRAMPNMAAVVGESVTSISAGSSAGKVDIALAREIFSMVGEVVEVDEKLVDAVTAVSGSGPAYFFYFIEALEDAAVKSGLEPQIAKMLVRKTFSGSVTLLDALGEEPGELRRRVTSKRGTTEAAIKVFESKKMRSIIREAVNKARARSKELSKA